MRLVVKKLDVVNLDRLQSLVVEHIDGIETGLAVLDSRLLLGDATVDVVAVDSQGALVLVTAGFTADEEMLLKAVEAYSWCLEYPEAIRRLYPSVDISAARPPRLMFVVERMPDAFHRKIKQLGFCEVDCVEFRHLDVSGTQAAYFDTIARLRRGASAEFQPAPIARRVSEPSRREPGDRPLEHGDKVVPLMSAPNSSRTTSVRLQKMLNANGHSNGSAPVIDIASRIAAPRSETSVATVEPIAPRAEVVRIDKTPRVEQPSKRVEALVPVIELARDEVITSVAEPVLEIAKDLLGTPGAAANAWIAGDAITRAILEEVATAAADSVAETNGTVHAEAPVAPKPQKFEGLKLPNDRVLTRQWMEFLNQMASGK
jgi:hypothetical protein